MKRCEYCKKLYKNLGCHQKRCPIKLEFDEKLNQEGIIEEPKVIHFSGGMKIALILRGNGDNEWFLKTTKKRHSENSDWYRLAKRLSDFEQKHKIRVEYDDSKDKLTLGGVVNGKDS